MGLCDTCGNDYDKSFEVLKGAKKYTFDSLECAAQVLAPECAHCRCRVLGHGIEAGGKVYCCAHCARKAGVSSTVDRA